MRMCGREKGFFKFLNDIVQGTEVSYGEYLEFLDTSALSYRSWLVGSWCPRRPRQWF